MSYLQKRKELKQNLPVPVDFAETMPAEWKLTDKGEKAVDVARKMRKARWAFQASIPIVCRGKKCPYADTCGIIAYGLAPEGERCPVEIAQMIDLFDGYVKELGVDENDMVDLSLLKELVDIDIQISRADKVLARDGDLIQDVVVGVSPKGEAFTQPQVHKAVELKERMMKRRHEILQLLAATRKDKENSAGSIDPSVFAAELKRRAEEILKKSGRLINVTPEPPVEPKEEKPDGV